MKFVPILCGFVILLSSCGAIKPAIPNLPLSQINTAPLPVSKIDIPVNIDLSSVFNDFTAKIPLEFSGEGNVGPGQYRWIIQRQPFNLSLSGNALTIIDAAHCNIGAYIKNPLNRQFARVAACDVDAMIGIDAAFNILSDYSLSANARLSRFDLNGCDVKVANLDIVPLLRPRAEDAINQALSGLNEKLGGYNFRALLQPAWNALCQPVKIADMGYIVLNPSQVRFGEPKGEGNFLHFSAGITAAPVFYLANQGKTNITSVPDISRSEGGNGFYLNLDVHLDYQQLNAILKNAVSDKKINVSANGYIDIQDAEIYGTGNNHLLIKVKFNGKQGIVPYHGFLYFTCLPQYDLNTGDFYINDIDFDANTITKLKEGPAAWILSEAVKKFLNNQVHFNVAGQINTVKDKLNRALNKPIGPNITLAGTVDNLSLQGILPEKDYILVRVSTTGKMEVKIN